MNRKQMIVGMLVGFTAVYVFAQVVIDKKLQDTRNFLDEKIIVQSAAVLDTASTLGRGGVSERIATVVPECPSSEGIRYDDLLASLDKGLPNAELRELSVLFNKCGDIAANRRAGMALLLSEEGAALADLVAVREQLGDYEAEVDTNKLVELVEIETKISELFTDLVAAQGTIITLLLGNVSPSDLSVENIRASAQILREELTTLTGRASTLRSELSDS